jgi:S-adenosylmethionine decarboxylase proenzyme
MFAEFESSGKHMICDFKEIKNQELLNNPEKLIILLKEICNNYNFEILGEVYKKFEPIGCTIIFLLSESHISIHSFPEKNYISFDLYTCRQYNDNTDYDNIFTFLMNTLNANNTTSHKLIIDRYF